MIVYGYKINKEIIWNYRQYLAPVIRFTYLDHSRKVISGWLINLFSLLDKMKQWHLLYILKE
ncbi:hypothetical protein BH10BAC2_BH10BAC2_04640 [soil metagenome]